MYADYENGDSRPERVRRPWVEGMARDSPCESVSLGHDVGLGLLSLFRMLAAKAWGGLATTARGLGVCVCVCVCVCVMLCCSFVSRTFACAFSSMVFIQTCSFCLFVIGC